MKGRFEKKEKADRHQRWRIQSQKKSRNEKTGATKINQEACGWSPICSKTLHPLKNSYILNNNYSPCDFLNRLLRFLKIFVLGVDENISCSGRHRCMVGDIGV